MGFSYSGDPASSTTDAIRFLIDDTDASAILFQDEELAYLYTTYGTVEGAAAEALKVLIRSMARIPNFSIGRWSENRSQAMQILEEKADDLAKRAGLLSAGVYMGGISVADKQAKERDTDRVQPAFKVGMHDFSNSSAVKSGEENWTP